MISDWLHRIWGLVWLLAWHASQKAVVQRAAGSEGRRSTCRAHAYDDSFWLISLINILFPQVFAVQSTELSQELGFTFAEAKHTHRLTYHFPTRCCFILPHICHWIQHLQHKRQANANAIHQNSIISHSVCWGCHQTGEKKRTIMGTRVTMPFYGLQILRGQELQIKTMNVD